MQSLREFFTSSSGLVPARQGLGLGWVISASRGSPSCSGQGSRSRVQRKKLGKESRVQRRLRPEDERENGEYVSDLLAGRGLQYKLRGELLLLR